MSQMRNSNRSAEWVAKLVADNPIRKIMNAQTGAWDGNILTCPVRLNFFDNSLHTARENKRDDGSVSSGFEAIALFPPCATEQVNTVLWPLVYEQERTSFPANVGQDGKTFGLKSPFRMQDEKQNYSGYTPGGIFISCKTQYKPPVVDTANNPIVDPARAYAGVWAMLSVNLFAYGIRPARPIKGVNFGLQAVMILADDLPFGGAGVDPKTQFAGVKIDASYSPAAAFGQAKAAPPAPPIPGMSLVG
jgi:hypothetical protein